MSYQPIEMSLTSRIAFDDGRLHSPVLDDIADISFEVAHRGLGQGFKVGMSNMGSFMVEIPIYEPYKAFWCVYRQGWEVDSISISTGRFLLSYDDSDAQFIPKH